MIWYLRLVDRAKNDRTFLTVGRGITPKFAYPALVLVHVCEAALSLGLSAPLAPS
jgi:hypothetical protein